LAATVYEGMFILDANRYGRDAEGVSGQVNKLIEQAGGEILVSRFWEERRLAYPIDTHRKGVYWLTYFKLDTLKLDEMHRKALITDDIVRHLFLKVDPRIVETLVAHAKAGTTVTYNVPDPTLDAKMPGKRPAPIGAEGWEDVPGTR